MLSGTGSGLFVGAAVAKASPLRWQTAETLVSVTPCNQPCVSVATNKCPLANSMSNNRDGCWHIAFARVTDWACASASAQLLYLFYFCRRDQIKCNHADYINWGVYNHLFFSLPFPLPEATSWVVLLVIHRVWRWRCRSSLLMTCFDNLCVSVCLVDSKRRWRKLFCRTSQQVEKHQVWKYRGKMKRLSWFFRN